jgi:hypothetical protein
MSLTRLSLIAMRLLLVSVPSTVSAQKKNLTDDDVKAAAEFGQSRKNLSPDANGFERAIGAILGPTLWIPPYVVGFAFTPTEWIKWQAHAAAASLKPYTPDKDDLASVFRVNVVSQPADNVAAGCYQVSNVVLRDTRKMTTIQPDSLMPTTQEYQNSFGAKLGCSGAVAIFSLDNLERIRKLDPNQEFLVSIATDHGIFDRKLKRGQFSRIE